jgi:hypothetical protein
MGMTPLLAAGAILGVTYLSSPYVALYRLGQDLRAGDCDALAADVDWAQLRNGLKQDVATAFRGGAAAPREAAATDLPPFGSSFVVGVAQHMVNRVVTPEGFVNAVQKLQPADTSRKPRGAGFDWGFFTGATDFVAWIHTCDHEPIAVRMRLEGASWKVTRVTLPGTGSKRT